MTYQIAHDDLAVSRSSSRSSRHISLGGITRRPSRVLDDSSDGSTARAARGTRGSSSGAATTSASATSSRTTLRAEDLVERLIELASHFIDRGLTCVDDDG